jgi:hypothetical protein
METLAYAVCDKSRQNKPLAPYIRDAEAAAIAFRDYQKLPPADFPVKRVKISVVEKTARKLYKYMEIFCHGSGVRLFLIEFHKSTNSFVIVDMAELSNLNDAFRIFNATGLWASARHILTPPKEGL